MAQTKRNFYGILTKHHSGGGMSYPYRHCGLPCTILKFPSIAIRQQWLDGTLEGYPLDPLSSRSAALKRDCVYDPGEHKAVYVSEA